MVPTLCLYFPRRRQFGCHEAFVGMSREWFSGRKTFISTLMCFHRGDKRARRRETARQIIHRPSELLEFHSHRQSRGEPRVFLQESRLCPQVLKR